jgi:glycyl-tRNA synthetase
LEEEELENGEARQVLKINPMLAPIKVNILPLIKKRHSEKALELYHMLKKYFMVTYDDAGNIGKRYRRGDVIGTPFAITVDDNTLDNGTVTLRDRDSMKQINVCTHELVEYIGKVLTYNTCQ